MVRRSGSRRLGGRATTSAAAATPPPHHGGRWRRLAAVGVGLAALLGARPTAGRPPSALPPAAPSPAASPTATPPAEPSLSLPFERLHLPNGLTVILHEDHDQPLVVVHVGYAVGSGDERPGRTGFAHLFEHLMFMGTRRVPLGKFDEWMELEGGFNNASTGEDRTVYYDVGPRHSLPLLLWMEADRLAVLGTEVTQRKLDTQREVVRNERREQLENQPYGEVEVRLPTLLFPARHPYHHPVIGSHEDLAAARLGDVRAFFERWYTPSNACLVVAGDFDGGAVRAIVDRTFGRLPGRATLARPRPPAEPLALDRVVRDTMADDVTLPKIVMAWPSPPLYAPGDAELDLAAAIASSGKGSRLYRSLVHERPIAQAVTAYQRSMQLASEFVVEAVARPGVSLDELEQALDQELARLRALAPSEAELSRAQNRYELDFVAQLQSLDGRASRLDVYQAHVGDPGYLLEDLKRYRRATPASVAAAIRRTLRLEGRVILRVTPSAPAAAAAARGRRAERAEEPS